MSNYWDEAGATWDGLKYPLKADENDLALMHTLLDFEHRAPADVLFLGVTQHLFQLGWPEGCQLHAADNSQTMLDKVWLGPNDAAILCDWRNVPMPDNSYDTILTDGGLSMLDSSIGLHDLAHSISRLLRPSGIFVTRCYIQPENHPRVAEVKRRLAAGLVKNLSYAKLLCGMALADPPRYEARLQKIYTVFVDGLGGLETFRHHTAASRKEAATLALYAASGNSYYFPPLGVIVSAFRDEGLVLDAQLKSAAEFGDLHGHLKFIKEV